MSDIDSLFLGELITPQLDFAPISKPLSELELWVKDAKTGDRYIYAVARNLQDTSATKSLQEKTWKLYERGLVYLVQKKMGKGEARYYEYIMMRSSKSAIFVR